MFKNVQKGNIKHMPKKIEIIKKEVVLRKGVIKIVFEESKPLY